MANSDAKQQTAGTDEEKTGTGEKQKWNVEAEPFHPYVGSMVRPLEKHVQGMAASASCSRPRPA